MVLDHRPLLAGLIATLVVTGCAKRQPDMYQWGSFPAQQYQYLLHEAGPIDGQISELESQAERAAMHHAVLPPGFRAHLGMLHLSAGNPQRARELWIAEKTAFPEASPFIDSQLLARLDAAAKKPEQTP